MLIISEIRRYPELMNASKPKGFPREMLADWLASAPVGARQSTRSKTPDDAAAMLFGMVMQDSGFKLMVVSNATMPQHLIEDTCAPRRADLPARRTQERLKTGARLKITLAAIQLRAARHAFAIAGGRPWPRAIAFSNDCSKRLLHDRSSRH